MEAFLIGETQFLEGMILCHGCPGDISPFYRQILAAAGAALITIHLCGSGFYLQTVN